MENNDKGKRWKENIAVALIIVLLIAAVGVCNNLLCDFSAKYWPARYKSILNDFFGEGRWEVVNRETKRESLPTTVNSVDGNVTVYLTYKEWTISVSDDDGEAHEYTISNHPYKLSRKKSKKRYSAKQAFVQQLMYVSHERAAEDVKEEILEGCLPEAEMACLSVDVSWRNGNPPKSIYSKLLKEDWFSYNATAEDWLKTDLYDFYFYIRAYDYKVDKLTEEEQEHLLSSKAQIEQALCEKYGSYADYEISF